MAPRVRAVKKVRVTESEERVALMEEDEGGQRMVPVAMATRTRWTAETLLYNTSKRSNLSRAGGANAAAKAADLPLASQEEKDDETNEYASEKSGGEDGEKLTQGSQKLPSDESFHDILDSVDGGSELEFCTPQEGSLPDIGEEVDTSDEEVEEPGGEADLQDSGTEHVGTAGGRGIRSTQRVSAAMGPSTPAISIKKTTGKTVASSKTAKTKVLKRRRPSNAKKVKNAQVSEKPGEVDEAGERGGDKGDAADSEVEEGEQEGGEEQPQAKTRKLRFPTEQSPIEVQGELSDGRKAKLRDSLPDKSLTPVRRRKKRVECYSRYLYSVLKSTHPDMSISKGAMQICESLINDMFERIMNETSRLLRVTGAKTLTSREIQTAVRLLMGGDLQQYAIREGTQAVIKAAGHS